MPLKQYIMITNIFFLVLTYFVT